MNKCDLKTEDVKRALNYLLNAKSKLLTKADTDIMFCRLPEEEKLSLMNDESLTKTN